MSRRKYYQQEKILKGAASHRRIEILHLLDKREELSTNQIVAQLDVNYQTGAHHIRKLVRAGLANSWREGSSMNHSLSPHGELIIKLLKKLK